MAEVQSRRGRRDRRSGRGRGRARGRARGPRSGRCWASCSLADVARADRLDELGFELPAGRRRHPAGRPALSRIAETAARYLPAGDPLAALRRAARGRRPAPERARLPDRQPRPGRPPARRRRPALRRARLQDQLARAPSTQPLTAPSTTARRPGSAEMQRHHYVLQALLYLSRCTATCAGGCPGPTPRPARRRGLPVPARHDRRRGTARRWRPHRGVQLAAGAGPGRRAERRTGRTGGTGGMSTGELLPTDPFEPRFAGRASGLLRDFNRAGVLSAADVHVARRLGALAGEDDRAGAAGGGPGRPRPAARPRARRPAPDPGDRRRRHRGAGRPRHPGLARAERLGKRCGGQPAGGRRGSLRKWCGPCA